MSAMIYFLYEKPVVSPISARPPWRPRLGRDEEDQQRGRNLDVEQGFADSSSPGHCRRYDSRTSQSAQGDISAQCKKIIERPGDIATAQSLSVCLCVAVFWLGVVMVPGYTFWYFSYVRDVSNGALNSETVDGDVVDLALFTRVMNPSVPPLLARRERADLRLASTATVGTTDDVGKKLQSQATPHWDLGGIARRLATTSQTSITTRTNSRRDFGRVARRFTITSPKYFRPRATSYRDFDYASSSTTHSAYPRNSVGTKGSTGVFTTLVADASSMQTILKPEITNGNMYSTALRLSPTNKLQDSTTERSSHDRAATQFSVTRGSTSCASGRYSGETPLTESSASANGGFSPWTWQTFLGWNVTSFRTGRPFTESAESTDWTEPVFHETTRSTSAVESGRLSHAPTSDFNKAGDNSTHTAVHLSTDALETEQRGYKKGVPSLNDSIFTERGAENETSSHVGFGFLEKGDALSYGTSLTEVPHIAFDKRRRNDAKRERTTDEPTRWVDEYDEEGDHEEAIPEQLKSHRNVILRGSRSSTARTSSGRYIWKVRFAAPHVLNTLQ
ncbi:hypothetical protein MRX96_042718 [Rhipicephalus microplus]